MSDLKIAVVGCAGRMGINLLRQIDATEGCRISGGTERPGSDALGKDIGAVAGLDDLGIAITDNADAVIHEADAVLDFTAAIATVEHARICALHGTALIIGTTGLSDTEDAAILTASEKTAVIRGANMSVGVNLLLGITRKVAAKLGPDWDIEVVEMHHRRKVDAPSGTALALGKAAAEGRDVDHDSVADRCRDGIAGARKRGDIGYAALRGGNVVGDHTVIFAADDERVEITHKASDRTIFARGAVTAGLWSKDKGPGLYDMTEVLDLD